MISVRVKLVGLVLGSFVPAIIGAVLHERAIERDLLEESGLHIKTVGARFEETLKDYEDSAGLVLVFAAQNRYFQRILDEKDVERVQRFVAQLGEVYKDDIIVASDSQGSIVAVENDHAGVPSLGPGTSKEFSTLLSGERLSALVPLELTSGQGFALVDAVPVMHESKQVGAIALLYPMQTAYLEHLKKLFDADLSLSINGKLIAQTKGHAAPDLRSDREEVVFREDARKLFAVETFRPERLQREGMLVELTASRDVTPLRKAARADLLRQMAWLVLASGLVLGFALRFARRLGRAISGIADAAQEVKEGRYVDAPQIKTGDEIEKLAERFNDMVQGLKERDRLKETFGRYVTRQVADHLLLKGNQDLGGELVPVTVLFSDIRSFTSISESMPPQELLNFLNEYFSGMVESVLEHHGVVDKFIGDAIMAVFGAPVPEPNDPLHAVKAALSMRERLAVINKDFVARGLPEIRTGIGLHSGQVVAGNMGHSERMEYTVIGDAVNLASRLEGMTKELGCDVILSEDLYLQVKDHVNAEPVGKIKVKGRDQEVMVYKLIDLKAA